MSFNIEKLLPKKTRKCPICGKNPPQITMFDDKRRMRWVCLECYYKAKGDWRY